MPRVDGAIDIARPPADVFAYLANFNNDPTWRANVVEMRPLGSPADLGGVWSHQVEVRKVPGRLVESAAVITACEPARLLSIKRASGPIRPEATYRLAPSERGTRLSFDLTIALGGLTWLALPLVWLFLKLAVGPVLPKDLGRLKLALES
jgi:hypothetical protein